MNKKRFMKVAQRVVVALAVVTLLICAVWSPQAEASGYSASYIKNTDLDVNYKDFLNSEVVKQLPDAVKDDDEISVIILLDVVNLMDAYEQTDKSMTFREYALHSEDAKKIEEEVASAQAAYLEKLDEQGIAYTATGLTYTTLLTGFELNITAKDFAGVCDQLDKGMNVMVSEVYDVSEAQAVTNTVNVSSTGIVNTDGINFDGSGLVVAVLDTGLDYAHSAFDVSRFTSTNLGLTKEDVAALLGSTVASQQYPGLTVNDVFISNKVPFGFDYSDQDPDPYSTHNTHGTHVSGIIVGNDDEIRGVAPNAQLVSMKVFSDVRDTALTSWILSALEDCVILGVDVINMSLGTAAGFTREEDEVVVSGVYEMIRQAGITLMVAASNSYSSAFGSAANGNLGLTSNPDTATVGSPGTYNGAMSVASISGTLTPYLMLGETIVYFDEASSSGGDELDFCENLLGGESKREMEYIVIPGVGRSADYTGIDVTGKIVLVSRGDNTFEEKALIAQRQGAAGIIIYNNVSGDIRMNVGHATLAVCSVSKDNGKMLVDAAGESGVGKLLIDVEQAAGPFISDFSSWGPTPNLNIKPEITGEGGNILSAVTGGGYDRLSGTSMATPNLAGVALLLRQYILQEFPAIKDDAKAVNSLLYRLMMSTSDIILNENGLPYAVRKQGSGLANLRDALATTAVITTYDADGAAMNKTKLELGDDPQKTGVYTMTFTVENFGSTALSYDIGAYVLTEGVSENLTNAGMTTVTEQAVQLTGATVSVGDVKNGTLNGNNLTVEAGKNATVTVTITLGDEDKAYMDKSFENGMYVEGFITLTPTAGTEVDMSVPYLAFYGDWTEAPIFDKDYYETNKDELDDGIDEEDKVKADAYATRPIGGVYDDYISYMGAYYFMQNPADTKISASRDYISLSNQDQTVHSLRYVWAGLLRGCSKVEITITDDATGEVIYETVDDLVRKSYGDGGSIYPANIEIEFDTKDYNLKNNSRYTVKLQGYLDYGDGGLTTNDKNVFEFPMYIDFEAPTVNNVEFRYEYDKTLKKNRLYADISVYDNHYAMCLQVGYVGKDENGNAIMNNFGQYLTPVYSQRNNTTVVTYELTDYIYQIKGDSLNKNSFVVTAYDYAINYASFEIGLPDNYVDFYMDGLDEGLTMSPNEVFDLSPVVYPSTEWAELLEYSCLETDVVRVVNKKVVAVGPGKATVNIYDPGSGKRCAVDITVLGEDDEGYVKYDKPVADVFEVVGYYVNKAHFMVASSDRDIGMTEETRFFDNGLVLDMYPDESVRLNYMLDAYFPNDVELVFSSGKSDVAIVDEYGNITAVSEGSANISVSLIWKETGKSTNYSATVKVNVKDPYVTNGSMLMNYYGNGGVVAIPDDLSIKTIYSFAFSNYEYVLKSEEELEIDDSSLSMQSALGNNTITKVIIPEGVESIYSYAFAKLTALEEVVFPSSLKYIEYGAFSGCSNLKKLSFSGENNIVTINQFAFEGCDLTGELNMPSAYVIAERAFAGNEKLEVVTLPETVMTVGAKAFAGCTRLKEVNIAADKVKFGEYAFTDCTSLTSFELKTSVVPTGMFYGCEKLKDVVIGKDVNAIYEYAFRDTAIQKFTIAEGNTAFKVENAGYILSADGTKLIAVAPVNRGTFNSESVGGANITTVGRGAFSHTGLNLNYLTTVVLENVTCVEDYGFAIEKPVYADDGTLRDINPGRLVNIQLGELTYIGENGFSGCGMTTLPKLAPDVQIGKYAFAYSALTSVEIPDGMNVPEGAFADCASLVKVVIGDNVVIGKNAFGSTKDFIFDRKSYTSNGKLYWYYTFATALKSLTIGDNVEIGDSAFVNAPSLEKVTLGANAKIGYMAFYNASALKEIDLSKAISIGDYAFSGDIHNVWLDSAMTQPAVSTAGTYIFSYHAPVLEKVDLTNAESVGAYAFAYCRNMHTVVLGEKITVIPEYAFACTDRLVNIDLSHVVTFGDYAFLTSALQKADLSSATSIGKYTFATCRQLDELKLNSNGVTIGEGAFAECTKLTGAENLNCATDIGAYAFAYTAITDVDLSAAVSIGDFAFMKPEVTPFTLVLGENLVSLGDNPFALCYLTPFSSVTVETFNGVTYEIPTYTYDISETVKVIDGSLYCVVPNGLELITYTNLNPGNVMIADGTVRITGMALAGTDVKMVTLPYTVESIGHKAFYKCEKLKTVAFTSYDAPILEEEFDARYYESLMHFPGSGDYGSYTDFAGNVVEIGSTGMIPYFMWNATGGLYHNVFYGANFVDYVGYVDNKLLMIRPSNGRGYESYILGQYFDMELTLDGATAADDNTLAFLDAIAKLPERVGYEDRVQVEAARALYSKITGLDQQALVTSAYSVLLNAEQRVKSLTPVDETTQAFIDAVTALPETITLENEAQIQAARELYAKITDQIQLSKAEEALAKLKTAEEALAQLKSNGTSKNNTVIAIVAIALIAIEGIVIVVLLLKKRKSAVAEEPAAEETAEQEQTEEVETTQEAQTEEAETSEETEAEA